MTTVVTNENHYQPLSEVVFSPLLQVFPLKTVSLILTNTTKSHQWVYGL